jgi:hypothetical protein
MRIVVKGKQDKILGILAHFNTLEALASKGV